MSDETMKARLAANMACRCKCHVWLEVPQCGLCCQNATKDNEASVPERNGPANQYQSCSDCEAQQCWGPGKCRCTCHNEPATVAREPEHCDAQVTIGNYAHACALKRGHGNRHTSGAASWISPSVEPAAQTQPRCSCEKLDAAFPCAIHNCSGTYSEPAVEERVDAEREAFHRYIVGHLGSDMWVRRDEQGSYLQDTIEVRWLAWAARASSGTPKYEYEVEECGSNSMTVGETKATAEVINSILNSKTKEENFLRDEPPSIHNQAIQYIVDEFGQKEFVTLTRDDLIVHLGTFAEMWRELGGDALGVDARPTPVLTPSAEPTKDAWCLPDENGHIACQVCRKYAENAEAERPVLPVPPRMHELLQLALIPLAALVVSGECVDAKTALSEDIKLSIIKAHDAILEYGARASAPAVAGRTQGDDVNPDQEELNRLWHVLVDAKFLCPNLQHISPMHSSIVTCKVCRKLAALRESAREAPSEDTWLEEAAREISRLQGRVSSSGLDTGEILEIIERVRREASPEAPASPNPSGKGEKS